MYVVWPVPVLMVLSTIQFMYLYSTTSLMLRTLFKYTSYWMLKFCKEILQYFQYSIHSKSWLLLKETSTRQNHKNYIDEVPKKIRDVILKFSINGSLIEQIIKDTNLCLFTSVSHIESHSFHKWSMNLLD